MFLRKFVDETIDGFCVVDAKTSEEIMRTEGWKNMCHLEEIGCDGSHKLWSMKTWRASAQYRQSLRSEIREASENRPAIVKEVMANYEKLKKAGLSKSAIKLLMEDL